MESKRSFLLHIDSLCVLDELTDAQAGKLFKAIKAYHLRAAERREQDGDTGFDSLMDDFLMRVLFAPFKAQFDRDGEKYAGIVEKNKANGLKGGRPKKEKPQEADGFQESEQKPNNPLGFSESEENPKEATALKRSDRNPPKPKKADSDNDSDNDKDSEKNKKESANADEKEGATGVATLSPDYSKFLDWMKRNAPYCNNPKNFSHQITEEEFYRLKEKYSGKELADIIEQIENRKDLRKRYTNLYRTVLNWIKRES